ncbi:hypothetical protein MANES_17G119000v8 [Manihot esculenta]|uniref:Uncharacterized protein n=1 Tax=Manihot esculenta TaxID=3983 RepID=A0ACB7G5E6_MANES|nr:hypothetical protein MANES_17G119000v8 [Manihot esculenta]
MVPLQAREGCFSSLRHRLPAAVTPIPFARKLDFSCKKDALVLRLSRWRCLHGVLLLLHAGAKRIQLILAVEGSYPSIMLAPLF